MVQDAEPRFGAGPESNKRGLVHERSRAAIEYLEHKSRCDNTGAEVSARQSSACVLVASHFEVYSDGYAIRGYGPAGCGWVAASEGEVVREGSTQIGYATERIAEIRAAAYALNDLPAGSTVNLPTDSMYVVKTMRRLYKRNVNLEHWSFLDEAVCRHNAVKFYHMRGDVGHALKGASGRTRKQGVRGSEGPSWGKAKSMRLPLRIIAFSSRLPLVAETR